MKTLKLPFTSEEFLRVFAEYNQDIWPAKIVFYMMAALALYLALKSHPRSDKIISGILAFFWLWMGVVYHLLYFSAINKAAFTFGILFIFQAFFFLQAGVLKAGLRFRFHPDFYGLIGAGFIAYALVLYPITGRFLGRVYPESPTFGLPCPTTIYTFGMLLWTEGKIQTRVMIIPLLWSLIGFTAALYLGITEDFGLLMAGIAGTSMIIARNRKDTQAELIQPGD